MVDFPNFLKMLACYEIKTVARSNSNFYYDAKEGIHYQRKETNAEHVCSVQKLGHYLMLTEPEFHDLNRLVVFETFLYHDDVEIITQDVGIAERIKRIGKEEREQVALLELALRYPRGLDDILLSVGKAYRANNTPEMRFCHATDKMDALVHELKYPADWGPKNFGEANVQSWFQPSFEYSPTFMAYFDQIIHHLRTNGYFEPTLDAQHLFFQTHPGTPFLIDAPTTQIPLNITRA